MIKFLFELFDQLVLYFILFLCIALFGYQQLAHVKLVFKVNKQADEIASLTKLNRDTQTKFDNLSADFVTLSKLPADSKLEFSNFKMNEKLLQTSGDLDKLKIVDCR